MDRILYASGRRTGKTTLLLAAAAVMVERGLFPMWVCGGRRLQWKKEIQDKSSQVMASLGLEPLNRRRSKLCVLIDEVFECGALNFGQAALVIEDDVIGNVDTVIGVGTPYPSANSRIVVNMFGYNNTRKPDDRTLGLLPKSECPVCTSPKICGIPCKFCGSPDRYNESMTAAEYLLARIAAGEDSRYLTTQGII